MNNVPQNKYFDVLSDLVTENLRFDNFLKPMFQPPNYNVRDSDISYWESHLISQLLISAVSVVIILVTNSVIAWLVMSHP